MSSVPRSCFECRRRKIRCDRLHPCNYCERNSIECVYPRVEGPVRRQSQQPGPSQPSQDVLGRLQALEQRVRHLEHSLGVVEGHSGSTSSESETAYSLSPTSRRRPPVYVETLAGPSLSSRPDDTAIHATWATYLTDVDPLLKLVDHQFVEDVLLTLPQPSAEGRALLSAIHFAAEVCRDRIAIAAYQAISREVEVSFQTANVLTQPTIPKLQAMTIYLTCGRLNMDQDYLSSRLADLVRLSAALHLDRDPVELGYLPADCEHRRRLWWHIVALDVRTAEACGTEPLIQNGETTASLPSMVRDASLRSDLIPRRDRHATCTVFAVVAIEMAELAKKFLFTADQNANPTTNMASMNQSHQALLNKHQAACECADSPICRLTAQWCQIYWSRQSLLLRHRDKVFLKRISIGGDSEDPIVADSDLQTCADILERVDSLRNDEEYSRWAWLWQNPVEWDVSAIALSTIAGGKCSIEYVNRAWAAIDSFFAAWTAPFGDPKHQRRWHELEVFRDWVRASTSTVM